MTTQDQTQNLFYAFEKSSTAHALGFTALSANTYQPSTTHFFVAVPESATDEIMFKASAIKSLSSYEPNSYTSERVFFFENASTLFQLEQALSKITKNVVITKQENTNPRARRAASADIYVTTYEVAA
jgi:hypothetical protein